MCVTVAHMYSDTHMCHCVTYVCHCVILCHCVACNAMLLDCDTVARREVGGRGRHPPVLHFFSFEPIFGFDLYQINYFHHALIKWYLMISNTGTLYQ